MIVSLPRYAFLPSMAKVPLGLTREPKFCSGTPCVRYETDRHYGAVSHIATSNGLTPTKDFLNSLRSLKNRRLPETTGLRFALYGPQRWKVMNQHARNNRFFETANDFRKALDNFFIKTLPRIAGSLPGRINDNFQKLDYAF